MAMSTNGSSSSSSLTTHGGLSGHQPQQMALTDNLSHHDGKFHQHSPISPSYGTMMMIGGHNKLYHHHQDGSIEGSPIHSSHELIKTEHLSNLNGKTAKHSRIYFISIL